MTIMFGGRFMTEIEKKYDRQETITVCMWPDCQMHKMDDSLWVYHPKSWAYPHYSHGLCPVHYRMARWLNHRREE